MSNSRRNRRNTARHQQPEQLRGWPIYSPQASARLRESIPAAVADRPTEAAVPTVEQVSNKPWSDFTQADYDIGQWRRACLLDTGQGDEDSKERYKLPVREPSGTLNRNGVHAAAGGRGIYAVQGISDELRRTTARKIVRLYRNELDEEPPERLLNLASMNESEGRQPAQIVETTPVAIREAPSGTPLTVDVQIIAAGWNKAGTRYYPPDMLARDVPKVYPAGTHMYLDHPTMTEEVELPERSVTRLAAVLASDPYTPDGGKTMRAQARVFAPHREFLGEAWRDIGVSINGDGEGSFGEREGRHGLILEALTHGRSIDFVTKAGAGGRILQLFESAANVREARNVGAWLESRIHQAFTMIADEMYGDGRLTREERITLSGAIGEALDAFVSRLDTNAAQLYGRDLFADPEPPAEEATTTSAVEAEPASQPADGTPPAAAVTSQEGVTPMSGENTQTGAAPATAGTVESGLSPEARAEIAEAQLRESQARITTLETQNATLTAERDTARGELGRMRVTEAARSVVTSALADTDLPEPARSRITEAVTREVPTTDTGSVDTTALTSRINEAVTAERSYIASLREAAGEGTVTGLGNTGDNGTVDVAKVQESLADIYQKRGMSADMAKLAAAGRTN